MELTYISKIIMQLPKELHRRGCWACSLLWGAWCLPKLYLWLLLRLFYQKWISSRIPPSTHTLICSSWSTLTFSWQTTPHTPLSLLHPLAILLLLSNKSSKVKSSSLIFAKQLLLSQQNPPSPAIKISISPPTISTIIFSNVTLK